VEQHLEVMSLKGIRVFFFVLSILLISVCTYRIYNQYYGVFFWILCFSAFFSVLFYRVIDFFYCIQTRDMRIKEEIRNQVMTSN